MVVVDVFGVIYLKEKAMNTVRKRKWVMVSIMVMVIAAIMFGVTGVSAKDASSKSDDYIGDITCTVEFSGIEGPCEFIYVGIPQSSVQVIEFQDGDDLILRKRPGRTSCTNMIIKSDSSNPALDDIWAWYENLKDWQYDQRPATISLVDGQGEEIARYDLLNTWPCQWSVVPVEGKEKNGTVVIVIEFVVEELYRMPVLVN